jgi:mRNA interferase MazF
MVTRAVARGNVYWINLYPITSGGQPMGCRPEVVFQKKNARILLDQLRCVDKVRLGKKMGQIDEKVWHPVLQEMLA